MIGVFRLMMITGLVASTYAGYRTVSGRRAPRNPAGLAAANLAPEERRRAVSRFGWRRRGQAAPKPEDTDSASAELETDVAADDEVR